LEKYNKYSNKLIAFIQIFSLIIKMVTTQPIGKYITYGDKSADDFLNLRHDTIYKDSIEQQQAFFDTQAKRVHWHKMYTKIIDSSD